MINKYMFKTNKYTRWYFNIVNARLLNPAQGYTEKHHIIPKSMGGSNRKSNLVSLTAKEHFVCHLLLTRMTDSKGMRLAALAMTRSNRTQKRHKVTGRMFQSIREAASLAVTGTNNPMYGKTHSPETRKKISDKVIESNVKAGPKKHSEEAKKKIGEANKGRTHSLDTRANWSKLRKGRPGQDNNSGRRWFNNGVHSVMDYECPVGFTLGRLPTIKNPLSHK